MSRHLTASDSEAAATAQRRAFDFTLLLSIPFVAGFLAVPDVIMRAMFARGAFTRSDAATAAATLAAYAIGLIPFVLIRSAVATFYARKDTATPVKAALIGIVVNIALKIALMTTLAQVGLALATAVGAWVNLLLVMLFAVREGHLVLDREMRISFARFAVAGTALAATFWAIAKFLPGLLLSLPRFRSEAELSVLVVAGTAVYGALILLLFGRRWLGALLHS
jgi:putative peptidoglycan lipid II flippase